MYPPSLANTSASFCPLRLKMLVRHMNQSYRRKFLSICCRESAVFFPRCFPLQLRALQQLKNLRSRSLGRTRGHAHRMPWRCTITVVDRVPEFCTNGSYLPQSLVAGSRIFTECLHCSLRGKGGGGSHCGCLSQHSGSETGRSTELQSPEW
jgi:hypothetical protein